MKPETLEKRKELSELSRAVAPLVERGEFSSINAAIIETHYKKEGHEEFNTFDQWKEKGFSVKKGEKAFFIWAKPLNALKEEKEGKTPETEEGAKFFPLCFLFSNKQVRRISNEN